MERQRSWRIGELAGRTGLTVRALHHYDAIGLLRPSQRSDAGHRLYGEDDVRRVYQIVALRQLGLSLGEVARVLAGGVDVRAILRAQLDALVRRIEFHERLRARVEQLLVALDGEKPAADRFLDVLEVMTMFEKYYTPEQLETLEQRRQQLGADAIERAQRDWAQLIEAVEAERARGTDPRDPRVPELARRGEALIDDFTGGDAAIRRSLQKMYDNEAPEAASRGLVKAETIAYWNAVLTSQLKEPTGTD